MTGQTTNAVRSVRSMWPATEPARWSLRRLRHLADIRPSNVDKKSVDGEANVRLCNYTDVYYNDSITSDMSFMPATAPLVLSLIHISEPTRLGMISYAVF